MLLIFASSVFSRLIPIDKCVPALVTPPPIPEGNLLQAQVVLRHGARTPGRNYSSISATGNWSCDELEAPVPRVHSAPMEHGRLYHQRWKRDVVPYPPSCGIEELITLGMEQHVELGGMFREYLVGKKLLAEQFSPGVVIPRATMVDRAIRSCMAFMNGMYPPVSENEVIQILTDTDSAGFLDPMSESCSEIAKQTKDFLNSDVLTQRFAEFSDKWRTEMEPLLAGRTWNADHVKSFCSWVVMVDCTDHVLPSEVTKEMAEACNEFMAFWHYGLNDNDKYRGVASSPLFREMFRMVDEYFALKTPAKFVIYSSHDTELAALLPTLGQTENWPPLVRSNFLFEVWNVTDTIMCRFVFNGRVLPISFLDNETLVPLSTLKSEMARRGYLNHCMMPEKPAY